MNHLKYLSCILLIFQSISAQNFWHQTNGPYGGATVYDFLQYNDNTIFLATTEGLIKSNDNGNTWDRINSYNVTCLGVDKLNTLYFGISGHLKRSTDVGTTWTDIPIPAAIKDFVLSYRDTILVGSWNGLPLDQNNKSNIDETTLANGVYRSFDYGNTWTLVNNGIQYPGVYELIILSNNSILVGTSGGGVYKSTNWGDSWTTSGVFSSAYSFCESFSGEIFTGTNLGIYYSTNFGDSWTYKSVGYVNKAATCIIQDENEILYAGTDINNGVYYSSNNGENWNFLGLNQTIYTLGLDHSSILYAGGLKSGIHRYRTNDSSWISVYNQGYTPVQVNHLWITDGGNLLAGTQGWGLKYSTNSGTIWEKINDPAGFNAIETINDSIFIGAAYSKIFVSNDSGKTWVVTGNISLLSLYYEPNSQIIFAGSDREYPTPSAIYSSNDFGQSWDLIYTFEPYTEGQWINPILVTKTNQVILASIVYSSQFGQYFRIYKSTDFGQSWVTIVQDNGYFPQQIIEDDSLNIFVLTGHYGTKLLVSSDEGETWITKSIPETECIASDKKGRLFRFFSNQVWYSIDRGSTWNEVDNSDITMLGILDAVINQNNRIYLATTSGVYFGEGDSIVVSVEKFETTKSFHLSQNYPNPFNPSTKIKFTIPSVETHRDASLLVTLKVYDVLGNEIATLVNEEKQPGTYEVEFDESELPSGIYFYQLHAGSFVETKKMILIK